jgi:hypothetical protein
MIQKLLFGPLNFELTRFYCIKNKMCIFISSWNFLLNWGPTPFLSRFVILLSGLDLTNSGDTLLPLQLFVDWIGGFLGDMGEQEKQASIVRVVVAGR